jgi:ataxia telangiectasia mutated family protein
VKQKPPSLEDVTEILPELTKSVTAKQATVASWAMIACAR